MKSVDCIICGCKEFLVVDKILQHTINLGSTEFTRDITNVLCKKCGLVFNNPRLDSNDLEELYSAMSRFKNPIDINSKTESVIGPLEKEQFSFILNHLQRKSLQGMKMMEIGCALGNFLRPFYDAGAEVYGIEPSLNDSEYAMKVNNVKVKREFFSSNSFPINSFDCITMLYVFEHVDDPLGTLDAIRLQLKPEGLFYLEVPDSSRPFVGLDPFFALGHLFSYTPKTLKHLLNKGGFELVEINQIGGVDNSEKAFPRLRAIAKKTNNNKFEEYDEDEIITMSNIMKNYQLKRESVIKKINDHLNPLIDNWKKTKQKIIIYGAGTHTSELLKHTKISYTNLIGLVDNNPILQNNNFLGYSVNEPNFEKLKPDVIIISARGWEQEIFDSLKPQRSKNIEVISLYNKFD